LAVSKRLRAEILRRDNSTCQKCGAKVPDVPLVIDHVVPIALGGSDDPGNLQALCEPCNSGKSATPPDAATVARVAVDAERWSRAMQAAATEMTGDLSQVHARRKRFQQQWEKWTYDAARKKFPLPLGWEESVDRLVAAGLPEAVLHECVEVAMRISTVKIDNKFRYMCGVAWKKMRALQSAASGLVGVPSPNPALPDHREYISALYGLTLAEQEVYGWIASGVCQRLGLTGVDEDALAGAIAEAEIEHLGRRTELIKDYLENYVSDGMRFVNQALQEWLEHDPKTTLKDSEVWELAADLAAKDEALSQFAWGYFADLAATEQDQWLQYARRALLGGNSLEAQSLRAAASRIAYDASEGLPLPSGMCQYRAPAGIGVCFEGSAFSVTFDGCPACGDPCHGRHGLCEGHLTALMDEGRPGRRLVVRDYEPLSAEA
jgi:hypothetical protein